MANCGVSSTEALLRGLDVADSTPREIMALGAFIDTFVSGGGCTTANTECHAFEYSRRACPTLRCDLRKTLSWDDSTLDTLEASEESTEVHHSKSKTSLKTGKVKHAFKFLKRRKSDQDVAPLANSNKKPENNRVFHSDGSPSHPIVGLENPKEQEPKMPWSMDLLTQTLDVQLAQLSVPQESPSRHTTTSDSADKPCHSMPTSSPELKKARQTATPDRANSPKAIRRQSTPKPIVTKARPVTPELLPKTQESKKRDHSILRPKNRSMWSFARNQDHQGQIEKSSYVEDDISKDTPRAGIMTRGSPEEPLEALSVTGHFACFQPKYELQPWSLGCHGVLCGQDMGQELSLEERSIAKVARALASHGTPPRVSKDEDFVMATPPRQTDNTSVQTSSENVGTLEKSPMDRVLKEAPSFPTEAPFVRTTTSNTDVLAKSSVEQTLEDASEVMMESPIPICSDKLDIGIQEPLIEDVHPVTVASPFVKTISNDPDMLAKSSVEQILEDYDSDQVEIFHDGCTVQDDPMENLHTEIADIQSISNNESAGTERTEDVVETSNPQVEEKREDTPRNDRMELLEDQIKTLIGRIMNLEQEIKETVVLGEEPPQELTTTADLSGERVEPIIVEEMSKSVISLELNNGTEVESKEQSPSAGVHDVASNTIEVGEISAEECKESASIKAQESSNSPCSIEENSDDDGIEVDLLEFVWKDEEINESIPAAVVEELSEDDEEGIEVNPSDLKDIFLRDSEHKEYENDENASFQTSASQSEEEFSQRKTPEFFNQGLEDSVTSPSDSVTPVAPMEGTQVTEKKKSRGLVHGLKKKLFRSTKNRSNDGRRRSTQDAQEVMPMTGVYDVNIDSDATSSLSPNIQMRLKRNRGRGTSKNGACEISLATGITTLPASNVMKSLNG